MDLLDFDSTDLYFEEPLSQTVQDCLNTASESYADNEAELPLLRAYLLNHDSLTVLVALYRFYFYQHRLDDALHIALLARQVSAKSLNVNSHWQDLKLTDFPNAADLKGMVRFYLMVLKGEAVMLLRLQRITEAQAMLRKMTELDPKDRMGVKDMLAIAEERVSRIEAKEQGLSYIRG